MLRYRRGLPAMLCRASQTDIAFVLAGFVVLLGALIVARRVRSRHLLRTFCLACEQPFEARVRLDWLGFRHMTCPVCATDNAYPTSKWFTATYVLVVALACTALTWQVVADLPWLPKVRAIALFVVAPAVVLLLNHQRSRALADVASRSSEPITPMQRVESIADMSSWPQDTRGP